MTVVARHPVATAGDLRVTPRRVIRSEWIKFWSLRSTTITLAAAMLIFVGIGLLAASMSASGELDGDGPSNPSTSAWPAWISPSSSSAPSARASWPANTPPA